MNKQWADEWMGTYARSAQEVVDRFWAKEGEIRFEDPILEQVFTDREELRRSFMPYQNTDPDNGVGIHTFTVMEFLGDEKLGVTHWEWSAEGTASFLGIPTEGKTIHTTGVCVHTFDGDGRITREIAYWDAVTVGQQLGVDFTNTEYWKEFA